MLILNVDQYPICHSAPQAVKYIIDIVETIGVCSNNCVKVKSTKLNNFDHGKTTIKKEREENAFGRDYS